MKRLIILATFFIACGSFTPASRAAEPFEKGSWAVTLAGGYAVPIGNTVDDELASASLSIGYFPWDHHALSLELSGYAGDQAFEDDPIVIGAVGFIGRWHFLRDDSGGGRWSIFFDGGVAGSYADQEYPPNGTTFNFISKLGLGGTYRVSDDAHLIAGARYFHISNAQIDGKDENPGYDGIQFWGGVMWMW